MQEAERICMQLSQVQEHICIPLWDQLEAQLFYADNNEVEGKVCMEPMEVERRMSVEQVDHKSLARAHTDLAEAYIP